MHTLVSNNMKGCREKSSVFCRKKFCHLGRTAQYKFGRTVRPNRTFGLSLLNSTANLANWHNFEVNGLYWQCCCAGNSKKAPRILIFSITMDAEYSFYKKSIAGYAPTFFGYNNWVLAAVLMLDQLAGSD